MFVCCAGSDLWQQQPCSLKRMNEWVVNRFVYRPKTMNAIDSNILLSLLLLWTSKVILEEWEPKLHSEEKNVYDRPVSHSNLQQSTYTWNAISIEPKASINRPWKNFPERQRLSTTTTTSTTSKQQPQPQPQPQKDGTVTFLHFIGREIGIGVVGPVIVLLLQQPSSSSRRVLTYEDIITSIIKKLTVVEESKISQSSSSQSCC